MTQDADEAELPGRALSNARDLVDKLRQQAAELEGDPRFDQGAALARAATMAAELVVKRLAESPPPSDRDNA